MIGKKHKITAVIILITFLIGLGWYHDLRTSRGSNDFDTYYFAGTLIRSGDNIYTHEVFRKKMSPYLYLPFFAIIMAPFTFLPMRGAGAIWYMFNLLWIIGSIYLSLKIICGEKGLKEQYPLWRSVAGLVSAVFIFMIWVDNVSLAQIDFMVFFFIVLSLFLHERDKKVLSGLTLAFITVIKLYPIYFLIYFVAKRRFKAIFGFIVGACLFAFIIPVSIMGKANYFNSMESWQDIRVKPHFKKIGNVARDNYAHFDAQFKPSNQSIPSVVTRYLMRDDKAVLHWKTKCHQYKIYWPHPFTPRQTDIFSKMLLFLIFAITYFNIDYSLNNKDKVYLSLEYSLVFISMILFFPMVKSHTLAVLVFPLIAFVSTIRGLKGRGIRKARLSNLFVLSFILYCLQAFKYMQVMGLGMYSVVLLWIIFILMLREQRGEVS